MRLVVRIEGSRRSWGGSVAALHVYCGGATKAESRRLAVSGALFSLETAMMSGHRKAIDGVTFVPRWGKRSVVVRVLVDVEKFDAGWIARVRDPVVLGTATVREDAIRLAQAAAFGELSRRIDQEGRAPMDRVEVVVREVRVGSP